MDRNTVTALLLIGFILLIFSIINRPPPPEEEEQPERTEQPDETRERPPEDRPAPEPDAPEDPEFADDEQKAVYPAPFDAFTEGEEQMVTLENEKIKLTLTSKGGRIKHAKLKDYTDYKDEEVELFSDEKSQFSYDFRFEDRIISTSDLYFDLQGVGGEVQEGEEQYVQMVLPVSEDVRLVKTFTLKGAGYMVNHEAKWENFTEIIPRNINYIDLNWQSRIPRQERDLESERNNTTIYYKYLDNTPNYLSWHSSDEYSFNARSKWIAFRQKFFTQTLISDEYFYRGSIESIQPENGEHVKDLRAELVLPYEHEADKTYSIDFYLGPTKYRELNQLGYYLERQVYLGWFVFRYVNQWIIIPIFNTLGGYFTSYGWVIFFLTLVIKIITLPLTYKSYLSMAKMRLLKPEIEELKEKHEGDMQKMQQAQMKLYQKAGVNPLSGCIPMLLQLPILIALFNFFPYSIELRHASFLWANDLSTYDVFWRFPGDFSIPFYGNHVSMFALLMAASTLVYTLMNNSMSGAQKEMKYVAMIIPFFLLFVFNSFSAGLTYYYFLFNVMSIGQQLGFKMFVDEKDLQRKIEENKKKPAKKSRFQQKLEEMQKKQEQIQKQRSAQKEKKKARKRK